MDTLSKSSTSPDAITLSLAFLQIAYTIMPPPISRRCADKNEIIIPRIFQDMAALSSGSDTIDLSTAENWLIRPELIALFAESSASMIPQEKDLSYASGIGGCPKTRQALANLFNTYFAPALFVDPSHIVLSAGGSGALDALVQQICDPGDFIMIATPFWSGLQISVEVQNEAKIIAVPFPLGTETDIETCVERYRIGLKNVGVERHKVKALLLCNPTNPTGACYGKDVLTKLVEFCREEQLHLISDEVYALSVHGGGLQETDGERAFTSVLSIDTDYEGVHVIYSLSKDFGCSGLRLGALITQHNTPVRLGTTLSLGAQVSCLATLAATNVFLNPSNLLEIVQLSKSRLQEAYRLTTAFCKRLDLAFIPAAAGPYLYVRLGTEADFTELLKRERVALVLGRACQSPEEGWFRVAFGVRSDVLREGLTRIERAVKKYSDHLKETS